MTIDASRRSPRYRAAGIAALFAAVTCPAVAWSHSQIGTLAAPAASTDFYQITCSDDGSGAPGSLALQVLDTAPAAAAALVSVLMQRGSQALNTTDAAEGDATPSPLITINAAAGVFDVLVYKTATGSEGYTLTFHCTTGPNGTGDHTGTAITTKQNQ